MTDDLINDDLIKQFSTNFNEAAQKTKSLLESSVTIMPITKEDKNSNPLTIEIFKDLKTDLAPRQKINFIYYSRKLQLKEEPLFKKISYKDSKDLEAILTDPNSAAMNDMVYEYNKNKYKAIVDAAFATIEEEKIDNGKLTKLTFNEDSVLTTNATDGLTYEKLLEIKNNFDSKNYDIKDIVLVITEEEEKLLEEICLEPRTYHSKEKGMLTHVLGMKLVIVDKDVLPVNNGIRDCLAIATTSYNSGILLKVPKEISFKIKKYSETKTAEITATYKIGALRKEETLVQKIQIKPII